MGVLPVVPPLEDDELLSSWLARTARFYDRSLDELLADRSRPAAPINLAGIDLGVVPRALAPIARLLGIDVGALSGQTIAASYPFATQLVAQTAALPGAGRLPRIRYAACPHCLEQQRTQRGFSWLRREWVLAPRTVCVIHVVPLTEVDAGVVVHPVWTGMLGRHGGGDRAGHGGSFASSDRGDPPHAPSGTGLLRQLADWQTALLAAPKGVQCAADRGAVGRMATPLTDVAWAFTRRDGVHGDRLVYEAFASVRLDSAWHIARRRREGPVEFRRMPLHERHCILMAVAVR